MPDCTSGEFRDVSDLGLPGVQQQLVEAVVATGTPTVVVVVSGRVARAAVDRRARARARVRVGAGRAGRRRDRRRAVRRRVDRRADCRSRCRAARATSRSHHDHRAGGGRSQIFGDYVDAPAWPLLLLRRTASRTRRSSTTRCGSTNRRRPTTPFDGRGRRAQHRRPRRHRGRAAVPPRRGRARRPPRPPARRLHPRRRSQPGASATVRFTVDPTQLAYYDEDMRLVIEPGAVRVMVGGLEHVVALDGRRTRDRAQRPRPTTTDGLIVH